MNNNTAQCIKIIIIITAYCVFTNNLRRNFRFFLLSVSLQRSFCIWDFKKIHIYPDESPFKFKLKHKILKPEIHLVWNYWLRFGFGSVVSSLWCDMWKEEQKKSIPGENNKQNWNWMMLHIQYEITTECQSLPILNWEQYSAKQLYINCVLQICLFLDYGIYFWPQGQEVWFHLFSTRIRLGKVLKQSHWQNKIPKKNEHNKIECK